MTQKFDIENHHWLNMMYKIQHKWSIAFIKDFLIAKFKSSLRSESMNHVLNGIANKTISLTKFVIEYENVLVGMRSSKLDEDFQCKQGAPQKAIKKSGILGHTAQVYTCKIFNSFENQFLNSEIVVFEVKEENSERVRII